MPKIIFPIISVLSILAKESTILFKDSKFGLFKWNFNKKF